MDNPGWDELPIGKKIHLYRMHANLNIEKLAKLSRVSPSYISKVESNKSIPSIEVLESLSAALGSSASRLLSHPPFSPSSPPVGAGGAPAKSQLVPTIVRKNERKKIRPPKTNVDYELLTPDLQRDLEFVMVVHPPGERTESFGHSGEESMLCLSGSICIVIGEEEYFLEAGDTLSFDCSVPHYIINDSGGDATLVIASTPASF